MYCHRNCLKKRIAFNKKALMLNQLEFWLIIASLMVSYQEELDWLCLWALCGFTDAELTVAHDGSSQCSIAGVKTRRAGFRDLDGPADGGRGTANLLVRAARLDPDHRDPRALARVVPGAGAAAARRDPRRPQHRPDRAARVQAALAPRAVGRPGPSGPEVVAARPPRIRPLLARPGPRAARAGLLRRPGRTGRRGRRLPPGRRPLRRPADFPWPGWSRSWSRPSRCRSCPCCGTSPGPDQAAGLGA